MKKTRLMKEKTQMNYGTKDKIYKLKTNKLGIILPLKYK